MDNDTTVPAEALSNYKRSMSDTSFNLDLQDALDMAYQAVGCVETEEVGWGPDVDRTMATLGAAYVAALARAEAAEAERDRLRAPVALDLAPPPVEEISAEEFARRESPHWAHVENAVEYVRAGRGDPQPATASTDAGLREALARYEAADERCACAFTNDMRGMVERRTAEDERRDATVALAGAARALLAAHAEALERERWIPVEERLPDVGQAVLVYWKGAGGWLTSCARRTSTQGVWLVEDVASSPATRDVTHWKKLPPPPAQAPVRGKD